MERRRYSRREFLQLFESTPHPRVAVARHDKNPHLLKLGLGTVAWYFTLFLARLRNSRQQYTLSATAIEVAPLDQLHLFVSAPELTPTVSASPTPESPPAPAQIETPTLPPPAILTPRQVLPPNSNVPDSRRNLETYARMKAVEAGLDGQRFVRAISCESTFNPSARSANGRYHGLMQYDTRTWTEALAVYQRMLGISDRDFAALEKDIYDPHFHIDVTAVFLKHLGSYTRWPNC